MIMRFSTQKLIISIFIVHLVSFQVAAENIDKIYHPYVDDESIDIEWRTTQRNQSPNSPSNATSRFSIGGSIADNLFAELYLIGSQQGEQDMQVSGWESELLWQLNEQGENWLDAGILVELEKKKDKPLWESKISFLLEKEWGRTSHTLNITTKFEFEDDVSREWGMSAAYQFRYRYNRNFEPGIEIYASSPQLAIGPMFQGRFRVNQNWLKWQLAWLKETREDTEQSIVRALIEMEF